MPCVCVPGSVAYVCKGLYSVMQPYRLVHKHIKGLAQATSSGRKPYHDKPYRGTSTGGTSDLITGRISSMFNTTGSLLQSTRAGQMRGLAVTSAERTSLAPEFPTIAESGVPGYDVSSWYSLFVPAKTPPDIISKMNADTVAILREPAIRSRFELLGISVTPSTPAELGARLRREFDVWGPLIKAANIKAE